MPAPKKNSPSTKKVSSSKKEADNKKKLKKTTTTKKNTTTKKASSTKKPASAKKTKATKKTSTSKKTTTAKPKKTSKKVEAKKETKKKTVTKKETKKKEEKKKAEPKKEEKKKTATKKDVKKPATKKEVKKTKKVIVDVIEDDIDFESNDESSLADFLDSSLPVFDNGVIKNEKLEDLEIDPGSDDDFEEEVADREDDGDDDEDESWDEDEEIDNQKKFFNELKADFLKKKEREEQYENEDEDVKNILELFEDEGDTAGGDSDKEIKKLKKSRPVFLYTKFVWKFLLIVGVLVLFVFYLFFSKLSIDIVPSTEALNRTLSLRVAEDPSGVKLAADEREDVKGMVKEINVSLEDEFKSSGEEFVGENLSARVKIVNNHGQGQTLVKTTRLLSPDNKLFRISEAVRIPAGTSVWVDVYPDKISREYAINPTNFIIPGLWVGLQDKIYAVSEEPFIFEQRKEKYVRASDIALAEKEISDQVLAEVILEIEKEKLALEKKEGKEYLYVYNKDSNIDINIDAEVEERKESFLAQAKTSIVVAFFPKEEVTELGHDYLKLVPPSNKKLFDFNPENTIYRFDSYDEDKEEVLVKATFVGKMMPKSSKSIINREEILDLNADQIATYLREKTEVDSFQLKFSPVFVKKAPKIVDRIEVNIINENK